MDANQKTAMMTAIADGLAPGDGDDEPGEEEWSEPAAHRVPDPHEPASLAPTGQRLTFAHIAPA